MTERGNLEPSNPVHPLLEKRDRLTSEWFYDFRTKYGVDDPDEATPEQTDEYDAGMDAIYARIREEHFAEISQPNG